VSRGHIRRRGSTWALVVDLGADPSTRRRKQQLVSGFGTRKDAQRALTEILGQLDQGLHVPRSTQTVAEFLHLWLPTLETRGLRPTTIASYEMIVEKHLIPRLGTTPLERLSAQELNACYAAMLHNGRCDGSGGLSPRSVRYAHTVLRKALSDANRWGTLARNAAAGADPPSAKSAKARTMKTWRASELRAFLHHIQGDELYACFWLAANTGMRRGEVLGLRWRDVNLDSARLAVAQTLVGSASRTYLSPPKTDRGRRSIALDSATVTVLRDHQAKQHERRAAVTPLDDHDFVFCHSDGRPLNPNRLTQAFSRQLRAAGLPKIRLHDLRHTHATLALEAGIHPKVISERLGHASVAVTLDIYSHSLPALQEAAAEIIASLLADAPPTMLTHSDPDPGSALTI
jgi:integrase